MTMNLAPQEVVTNSMGFSDRYSFNLVIINQNQEQSLTCTSQHNLQGRYSNNGYQRYQVWSLADIIPVKTWRMEGRE